MLNKIDDPLTELVINAAYEVHNIMGLGFLEKFYVGALALELDARGLLFELEKPIIINYKGHQLGEGSLDIFVHDDLIIEVKAVQKIAVEHELQLVNYLTATGFDRGLLINFGARSLQIKRKCRKYTPKDENNK